MPVLLVVAVAAGVAIAAFTTNTAPAPIAAVPAPPLDQPATDDPTDNLQDPDEPQDPAPAAPPESDEGMVGIVREHFDVAQYTYLRLAVDGGEAWAAVYRAPVKDGKPVTLLHVNSLRNFHSRELNRDFDTIYFGVLPGYETAPSMSANAANTNANTNPGAGASAKTVSVRAVAGGTTIADLAKSAASLEGKPVTVVGRVVKETDGILGRNWIHLVDGTGDAKAGSNDLLVTTDATAAIGDDVVAKGTVRTNQDFGSGYAYKFMLEKATVTPAAK